MKYRMIDKSGDWTFGNGIANYLLDQNAVAAGVRGRLLCFLNDCFFDAGAGIDWFNLLGSKNKDALIFSIRETILQSPGITSVQVVNPVVDANRNLTVTYTATTSYGAEISDNIDLPTTPYSGISKFIKDIAFTGQTSIQIDVSRYIRDAYKAVWMLYDMDNNFVPVVGAVQPLSTSIVQITMVPAAVGNYRLIGIA